MGKEINADQTLFPTSCPGFSPKRPCGARETGKRDEIALSRLFFFLRGGDGGTQASECPPPSPRSHHKTARMFTLREKIFEKGSLIIQYVILLNVCTVNLTLRFVKFLAHQAIAFSRIIFYLVSFLVFNRNLPIKFNFNRTPASNIKRNASKSSSKTEIEHVVVAQYSRLIDLQVPDFLS